MPTIISHSIVGVGLSSFFRFARKTEVLITVILLSSFPDFDTILMGIFGRDSIFQHRGFMHSILFAAAVCLIVAFVFYKKNWILKSEFSKLFLAFFLAMIAHPVLDGFSTGFRFGVTYFAPFDMTRYLFWISPLPLAPLSPVQLLSERGISLFLTEASLLWTLGFAMILWNKASGRLLWKYCSVLLLICSIAAWAIRLTTG